MAPRRMPRIIENGIFKNRKELLKVAKLGPKAFEQCAGFLRISESTQPLDATSVHPESYGAAEKLLALGYQSVYDFGGVIDWPYELVKEG